MKIYHNSRNENFRSPFGAVEVSTEVKLALRIESEADYEKIKSVQVRFWTDDVGEMSADMQLTDEKWIGPKG